MSAKPAWKSFVPGKQIWGSFRSVYANALFRRRFCLIGVLAVFSLMLIAPHFIYGYPNGHSAIYNVPWTYYFTQQFFAGDLYPRWLYDFQKNVGSPTFYFYAPAPFYLHAFTSLFDFRQSIIAGLSLTHFLLFFLSGLSFFVWMRSLLGWRYGLLGAVGYLVLPYHYIDLEVRNTIGEAMAYIWAPLLFYGLRRIDGAKPYWLIGALAYAGLVYSHLPSALLMVLPLGIFTVVYYRDDLICGVRRLSLIGGVGVLLAAPYLLPALGLQDMINAGAWTQGEVYRPEFWLLPAALDRGGFIIVVFGALLAPSLLAVCIWGAAFFIKRITSHHAPLIEGGIKPLVWALFAALIVCWLFITQATTFFWANIDILRQVQFPWRLGVAMDFLSATLILLGFHALLRHFRFHQISLGVLAVLVASIAVPFNLMVWHESFKEKGGDAYWLTASLDDCCVQATEFWTPSVTNSEKFALHGNHENYARFAAELDPVISMRQLDRDESVTLEKRQNNRVTVSTILNAPATIRISQAYFPLWVMRAEAGGKEMMLRPDQETGLLLADLPEGEMNYLLTLKTSAFETIGFAIGGLSGFGVGLFAYFNRRKLFS